MIVMLPKMSAQETITLYDRLRSELIQADILPGADYVTFSAGIAEYTEGDSEETLLKKADDALYRTKEGGRDRCMLSR